MSRKFFISKEDLIELLKKNTKIKLSKDLGCSVATINNWCNKYDIQTHKNRKKEFEEVKVYFEDQGCELLEEKYYHNKHPMKYRCKCGNISKIKWHHFLRGERCKECKRRRFFGELNHKWNFNKTNEERMSDRKYREYNDWKKNVFTRDDYTCQICKKRGGNLNAHHLDGYDNNHDKRLLIDNGITLCEPCHKYFHAMFGYGKNTREQFVNSFFFNLSQIEEFGFTSVTEECAKAVYPYLGCGDPKEIDRIATNSLRDSLNEINFSGHVVICEGKKDDSYGMYEERVGKLNIPTLDLDIACDPVDGSTRSSNFQSDACSLLVLASKNSLYIPNTHYVKKAITRKDIYCEFKRYLLELTIKEISQTLIKFLKRKPIILLLKRERNQEFIDEFRKNGCHVRLINDCDVLNSLLVFTNEIDMYYGIGGAPEAVIAASAVKAYDGEIEVACDDKILNSQDLVNGHSIFIATGVTDGTILDGVHCKNNRYVTHTLFATDNEKNTIRELYTRHGN